LEVPDASMMSFIEVLRKPFDEKSLIDSLMIFSLRFKGSTPQKDRNRPVGFLATINYRDTRVKGFWTLSLADM
jgi:hypothetical protein